MLNFTSPITESHTYNNFSMKEKSPVAKINLRGNLENKNFTEVLEMDKSTIEKSAEDLEQQNATILASCNDIETKTNDLDNQNMHKKNEFKDVAVKLHDINDSNETNDFHKKVQLINTYGMANEDNVESKNGVEHRIATPLFDSLLKLKELRLKIENAEIIKSLQLRHDTSKSKHDETMIQYQWHITHDKAKQEEAAQVKAKREQERKEKEAQLIAKMTFIKKRLLPIILK